MPAKKRPTVPADAAFDRAAAVLRVLGLVENLRVLVLLLAGPRSAPELARATAKPTYLVTRRLSVLVRAGLVVLTKATRYRLRDPRTRRLVRFAVPPRGRAS